LVEIPMKWLRFIAVSCVVLGLIGCGGSSTSPSGTVSQQTAGKDSTPQAKEPSNQEKILGAWEPSGEKAPSGLTLEFLPDGKIRRTINENITEASYTVEGDKVTITARGPGGKEEKDTGTITKLTDTELVVKDDKDRQQTFKRKTGGAAAPTTATPRPGGGKSEK